MEKCYVYHTGVHTQCEGLIKDNKVYLLERNDETYLPGEMYMAREECEGGLIQFQVNGKWGFADIHTGEIKIEPKWDYVGPFYNGYAHVALGCEVQGAINNFWCHIEVNGGKHGYIDISGKIVIPLEYDFAEDCNITISGNRYFRTYKNFKCGLVNNKNKIIIPFQWDGLDTTNRMGLIFCGKREECELNSKNDNKLIDGDLDKPSYPLSRCNLKWGVYDKEFNLVVNAELDEMPIKPCIIDVTKKYKKMLWYYEDYLILKKEKKYGILCSDGRWIANILLTKKQVINMVNKISGRRENDLYIFY